MSKNISTEFSIQAYPLQQTREGLVISARIGTRATKINMLDITDFHSASVQRQGSKTKPIPCTVIKLKDAYYGVPKSNYDTSQAPTAAAFICEVFSLK